MMLVPVPPQSPLTLGECVSLGISPAQGATTEMGQEGTRVTATTDSTRMSWVQGKDAVDPTRSTAQAPQGTPLVPAPQAGGWRESARRHRASLVAADVLASLLAVALGAALLPLTGVSMAWALAPLAFAPAVALAGGLDRLAVDRGASCWTGTVKGAALALLVFAAVTSILGVVLPPLVLALYALAVLVASIARIVLARRLGSRRRNGQDLQRAVVIGASDASSDYVVRSLRHPEDGIEIVGQLRVPRRQGAGPLPFLGSLGELSEVVAAHEIDLVIVVGALPAAELRRVSWALAGTGADLIVSPGLAEVGAHRLAVLPTTNAWNGSLVVAPRPTRDVLKTVLDRTAGTAMLLVAAPIIAVFGLLVRFTSEGGTFYSQTRVGKNGVPFRMWKIRSMYKDADARRAALLADNDGDGIIFKQKNDPRITPVGRFIRRYSIDELPQLWNVVRGDMSLIGPRPALPEEVAQYDDLVTRRLLVTPGLTGLWQVSGRSNLSWERTVELDLRYVDNHTFAMDAKIMAATGSAVFGASGAY